MSDGVTAPIRAHIPSLRLMIWNLFQVIIMIARLQIEPAARLQMNICTIFVYSAGKY